MNTTLNTFTDVLADEICNSQPMSLPSSGESRSHDKNANIDPRVICRPLKGTGQRGQFRSTEEIDPKYRDVFSYPYFNLVQSRVIEDALYSDKSIVVCAPTGSGKTVVFEMAIVQLLMELEDKQYTDDFKIIYMAPVKALCTERLTEWYPKFTKLGLMCIEVTGDTTVDFTQLKPYKIIITTPEKWDMLTRRWRDHRGLVEVIKLFLIDEVHILNDELRGPVLEAVVSRMKTIENSAQSVHRIEQLQKEMQGQTVSNKSAPRIRFVAVSATVSNPEDVAEWLGTSDKPAVFYKFGDECRPVKLKRIVEGYPCPEGTSIFKFDIILNYKLWPIIQKYHSGKPTLIFCNTRKSVALTAETLSRELTINFNAEQKAKLTTLASSIKNKKLQALVMSGVGCHHAGLLYEERLNIEAAFRNRDLPILITTTTLAMGVNLPAHLVIVKNTQQYVNGAYQEYSISTVLQMVGRAGRPQFDTEATAVIMTRLVDKPRYQALVGGCEPLQSFLHKRLAENLNSEAALGTVGDVAQCVQWLRSTFLYVRAARDPKKYLGLPQNSQQYLISKKIEELCVKAMNGLASSGLITMDEASCIESTEAGRLMSIFYLDLETMKLIMKIEGTESLERLLMLICESHELADMHLRMDERRCLNTLNRNNAAATIRFPMKGKISTRQMKLNCIIQAVLGCLTIPDPSLNQEAMKVMRIADRVCKCVVTYVTRSELISHQPQFYSAVLNAIVLAKCVTAHLWENSPFVSKQLKGIGPTFSTLLATAGKVNFMLLEESHPRDLERIMNKGAPAGNILRKQVSLLPKYQLTMTPVDEKTVTVQLLLLNQAQLAQNMDNLTAGDSHKSYIIVGDSNNHLLLLVAFKDKDLICIFNGTITHEVRRKHNSQHKIIAHCISSSFVGIDVQSEYLFNDLEQYYGGSSNNTLITGLSNKKSLERQTCITDTFKERKRKYTDATDKTQPKEKKKRDNTFIEKIKHLNKSAEAASNNLYKTNQANLCHGKTNTNTNTVQENLEKETLSNEVNIENIDSDEFIDDEKIDSILNNIENEMCKSKTSSAISKTSFSTNNCCSLPKKLNVQNPSTLNKEALNNRSNQHLSTIFTGYKTVNGSRKRKPVIPKSNYNFIDLLEKKSLSDENEKTGSPDKNNGFSDTIKSQIQKYLYKTKSSNAPDRHIKMLVDNSEDDFPNKDGEQLKKELVNLENGNLLKPINDSYPRYEIKEISGGENVIEQNNIKKKEITQDKDLICTEISTHCDITSINHTEGQHTSKDSSENYDKNKEVHVLTPLHKCILSDTLYNTNHLKDYHMAKDNNLSGIKTNHSITSCIENSGDNNIRVGNNIHNEIHAKINSAYKAVDCVRKDADKCRELTKYYKESDTNFESSYGRNERLQPNNRYTNKSENSISEMCFVAQDSCHDGFANINKSVISESKNTCSDLVVRYKNLNVKSGKISRNDINDQLEMKGINYNEHSNPPQCSETSCDSFIASYSNPTAIVLNETANISSNHTMPRDKYKQKTEYVKRYTYSTRKVDVCTKQTPEYCVQLIKKVNVDFDITAIVSRKHNSFQNKYKSDCKEPPKSSDDIKCIEFPKPEYPNQNDFNEAYKMVTTINNRSHNLYSKTELEPVKISRYVTTDNYFKKLPNNIGIGRENNEIDNTPEKSDKSIECEFKIRPNQPRNSCDLVQKPTEIRSEDFKVQGNVDCDNLSGNLRPSDSEDCATTDKCKIKNILLKYGTILGNKSSNNETTSGPSIHKTETSQKSPTIKPKKPFKITDIHKLHASLPNIVHNTPQIKNSIIPLPTIIHQFETEQKHDLNSNQYIPCIEMSQPEKTAKYYSMDPDLDLEPINLPENVDELEHYKDFKIDQAMFDPKALLQCVMDEDGHDIVPPPPEFCDSIKNSPGYDNAPISVDKSECFTEPYLDIYEETDTEYNESIFDDQSTVNLTPSREIETWNLSREDSWELNNPTTNKSFTVMRKNANNDYNVTQNSSISRHVRLGKYRMNPKNKLKIRK